MLQQPAGSLLPSIYSPSASLSPPPLFGPQVSPGDGLNRGIQVVLGGQSSAVESYSFGDPRVNVMIVQQSEISPYDNVIILRGLNFGLSGRVLASAFNFTSAADMFDTFLVESAQLFGPRTVVECLFTFPTYTRLNFTLKYVL